MKNQTPQEKTMFSVDVLIANKVVAVITTNAASKELAQRSALSSVKCKAKKAYSKKHDKEKKHNKV